MANSRKARILIAGGFAAAMFAALQRVDSRLRGNDERYAALDSQLAQLFGIYFCRCAG